MRRCCSTILSDQTISAIFFWRSCHCQYFVFPWPHESASNRKLHCSKRRNLSINSCVGSQPCRKSTSQFNLSGMDRYWLYRIYRSRCSAAAGSSCGKSHGYCQYGTVSLFWKSRLYYRWKHLHWRWYDKTNDLSWWLWVEIWHLSHVLETQNVQKEKNYEI